jgi:hypothetical protein
MRNSTLGWNIYQWIEAFLVGTGDQVLTVFAVTSLQTIRRLPADV